MIPSIEVVIGLVGSTIGVGICLIFPALCYVKICKAYSTEKRFAQAMVLFGCSIMILGTMANLNAIDQTRTDYPVQKVAETVIEQAQIPHIPTETAQRFVDPNDFKKEVIKELPNKTIEEWPPAQKILKPKQEKPIEIVKNVEKSPDKIEIESNNEKPKAAEPLVVAVEKPKEKESIAKDAILKEDQEIAIEEAKEEKIAMEKELKELKDANKVLNEQVNVMKDVIVKKNEETQQLVLKKFEEIAEKIEKKDVKMEEKPKEELKIENEVVKENVETTPKTLEKIVEDLAKFIDEQKKDMPAQETKEDKKDMPAQETQKDKKEEQPDAVVQKDPIIKLLTEKQKNLTNTNVVPKVSENEDIPAIPQLKSNSDVNKTEIAVEKTIVTIGKTVNESERIKRETEGRNEKAESLESNPKMDLNVDLQKNVVMQEKEFRRRRKR